MAEPSDTGPGAGQPFLTEPQRGMRALVLGAILGAVLALLGRRH